MQDLSRHAGPHGGAGTGADQSGAQRHRPRVLPIESAELEQLVSTGLTIATALVSWWKNNSFTPEAIEADDFLCQLKEHK